MKARGQPKRPQLPVRVGVRCLFHAAIGPGTTKLYQVLVREVIVVLDARFSLPIPGKSAVFKWAADKKLSCGEKFTDSLPGDCRLSDLDGDPHQSRIGFAATKV